MHASSTVASAAACNAAAVPAPSNESDVAYWRVCDIDDGACWAESVIGWQPLARPPPFHNLSLCEGLVMKQHFAKLASCYLCAACWLDPDLLAE